MVELAAALIRAPSPSGAEGPAARVLLAAFEAHGFDEAYLDEVGNAIGIMRRGPGPTLMLNGHLDTVPVGDLSRWPHPPLAGVVAEGRLWGRGACDMKGALASMVFAASDAAASGFSGTLIVSGVVQEEVGGAGARHLAKTLRYDAVVLGEPSKLRLMLGHRGSMVVEVVFPGAIAHAAKASLGENALAHAARYLLALEELELPSDAVLGSASATPTRLVSSPADATNVVPGEAVLTVDYRSLPGETVASVLERLQSIAHDDRIVIGLGRAANGRSGEDSLRAAPAYLADSTAAAVHQARKAFGQAVAEQGRQFSEGVWWFCTDAPHLAQQGAPVIGFGPGEEELAHTTNESVAVADLVGARAAYREFITAFLGAGHTAAGAAAGAPTVTSAPAPSSTAVGAAGRANLKGSDMLGKSVMINGDSWTIVDVAPAAPLGEMVAAILEDEGLVTLVRGADMLADVFSHLGSTSAQTSYVLVPEADGERALAIIAETVTDYQGDELDDLLERMASGEVPLELAPDEWGYEADEADADSSASDDESTERAAGSADAGRADS